MIDSFVNQVYQIFETLNCGIITAATMPNEEKPYYDQKELFDTAMTNYLGIAAVLNEISQKSISQKLLRNFGKVKSSQTGIPVNSRKFLRIL